MDGDNCYLDRAVELSKLSLSHTEHVGFWDFLVAGVVKYVHRGMSRMDLLMT